MLKSNNFQIYLLLETFSTGETHIHTHTHTHTYTVEQTDSQMIRASRGEDLDPNIS